MGGSVVEIQAFWAMNVLVCFSVLVVVEAQLVGFVVRKFLVWRLLPALVIGIGGVVLLPFLLSYFG